MRHDLLVEDRERDLRAARVVRLLEVRAVAELLVIQEGTRRLVPAQGACHLAQVEDLALRVLGPRPARNAGRRGGSERGGHLHAGPGARHRVVEGRALALRRIGGHGCVLLAGTGPAPLRRSAIALGDHLAAEVAGGVLCELERVRCRRELELGALVRLLPGGLPLAQLLDGTRERGREQLVGLLLHTIRRSLPEPAAEEDADEAAERARPRPPGSGPARTRRCAGSSGRSDGPSRARSSGRRGHAPAPARIRPSAGGRRSSGDPASRRRQRWPRRWCRRPGRSCTCGRTARPRAGPP